MKLSGLHVLLTYQCNFECDHCFVWGSPWQDGTLTLRQIENILAQAKKLNTIEWIYFEGGEPFLYYPILLKGVKMASDLGFQVGFVTNGYWATTVEDAYEWLFPFQGWIGDLSISSDLFHYDEVISQQTKNVLTVAEDLGIPIGVIRVAQPDEDDVTPAVGQLPPEESAVMYRGRAAQILSSRARHYPWKQFNRCPHEDLYEPGRVHLDPFGNLSICQGISIGNLFNTPLREICASYDGDTHTITGPLIEGGPAELAQRYGTEPAENYADACHLCYETRRELRGRFPDLLVPDQVYGVTGD